MLRLPSELKRVAAVSTAAARRFASSTAGKPIECLAAVAWQPDPEFYESASKPAETALSLEKVVVDPPGENGTEGDRSPCR